MARISTADAATVVQEAVGAAGGEISHNDLVTRLQNAGHAQQAGMLMTLRKHGYLVFRVDYDPTTQKSTLMVTLPA